MNDCLLFIELNPLNDLQLQLQLVNLCHGDFKFEGHLHHVLELCRQNRSPEGKMDDLKDWVTSMAGGQSFTFRVADALEFHGPDRGNKENLTVSETI